MERAKTKNRLQRRWNFWGYLFILPNFIGFVLFMLVPIIMALVFSFTNYDVISTMDFIGFENYIDLFTDDQFLISLRNTLWYCVLTVPSGVVLALLMAVLLNRQLKGMAIFRTLVFIPVITSMVAVSLVWSMLYEDNSGLLNILLGYLGLGPVHWLTDTNMAMISIAIMSVWKGLGYNMTIFLAGLQGVPGELYEAATIDGANSVQKFFKITVPMIGPTTYFVTLMALIGSLQVFDQVNIMTGGGPVDATKTVAFYLYQYGFQFYKMGYACAAAYVLSAILIVAISVPYGSMPSNRGDMSAAEFSDNYNDLAAFIDFGEYERMTPDGLRTDMPPNIFVLRLTDGGSIPEFTLTESDGLLTRVEFTAEKSVAASADATVDTYGSYMQLAVMSYVWGRPGAQTFDTDERNAMLDYLDSHRFESFETEWAGVRVRCDVNYSGYSNSWYCLYPVEDENQSFDLHFALELL